MAEAVSLRPAAPQTDDGLAYARLLNEAAAGMYRMKLGRRYDRVIAEAYLEPAHDHSFQYAVFAADERAIVGMATGYSAADHATSTDDALIKAAGWRAYRMGAHVRVMSRLFDFMGSVPDGDFYVHALAVNSAERSRGIGSQLLDRMEAEARRVGSRRLVLDVAATNKGGRRLYDRRGMVAEAESPRWFGLPNTNVIRMVLPLDPVRPAPGRS
ncbi:MAG: GNAT family N-acetyltransferase [Acidimicrobiia bacterium]|nr:GNAT family N-acetyltransferase [Acidimicrobiia bacterium]